MPLFVISAPSGTGKTTVVDRLLKEGLKIRRVVTATTRPKRENEVDNVGYIFMSVESFQEGIRRGDFLEYSLVYGNYYGTPKDQIIKNEQEGYSSLLVIDVQGARKVKESVEDSVLVFLLPPSLEELKRRLLNRGFLDYNVEERLKAIREEIACAKYFDYIVVNDYLDNAVSSIRSIIVTHTHRRENFMKNLENHVKDEEIKLIIKERCKIFEGGAL